MNADSFEWQVPSEFNFAVDVVDAWAKDETRIALLAVNDTGNEKTYTFADISHASKQLANLLQRKGKLD